MTESQEQARTASRTAISVALISGVVTIVTAALAAVNWSDADDPPAPPPATTNPAAPTTTLPAAYDLEGDGFIDVVVIGTQPLVLPPRTPERSVVERNIVPIVPGMLALIGAVFTAVFAYRSQKFTNRDMEARLKKLEGS